MRKSLVQRGISQVKRLWTTAMPQTSEKGLSEGEAQKVLALLRDCAAHLGGEVSARQRAVRLGEIYLNLNDTGRKHFLSLIVHGFGPDPKKVEAAHDNWQKTFGTPEQWSAEAALRAALRSPRLRILTQFNALPQGVKFLVDLRADLLRYMEDDPALASLDRELETRFAGWFDVGFLELKRITWHTPAATLESLIRHEAVHKIQSWTDLKNRLDSDRRCYGFFHPRMPEEPLIFVEVALINQLAGNVQDLLDEKAPIFDAQRADTAIFYSISNTQVGLRGVSFGHFLLKRVIDDLKHDFPRLTTYATLSPLPELSRWAKNNDAAWKHAIGDDELQRIARAANIKAERSAVAALLETPDWFGNESLKRLLQTPLTRLAANYLNQKKIVREKGTRPLDPVARFHLGNGARVERLNYLGDTSGKGLAQSYGMMVNYLYDPDTIERNVEALLQEGKIDQNASVRRAAKGVVS